MFCREHVAQLRDITQEIRDLGAELFIIGNGSAWMAKAFSEDTFGDAPDGARVEIFTDPSKKTYAAAGLRGGAMASMSLSVLKNAGRALSTGFMQGRLHGDPWQQGGVFVFGPGPKTHFSFVSRTSGDHPANSAVVSALRRAVA